jgi:hypothetical protein
MPCKNNVFDLHQAVPGAETALVGVIRAESAAETSLMQIKKMCGFARKGDVLFADASLHTC